MSMKIHAPGLKQRNEAYSNPVVDQSYINDVGYNNNIV